SLVSMTVGSTKNPFESSVPPPTTIWVPSCSRASAIASSWVRNDDESITAPMKLEKSATSPTLIVPTSSARRSRSAGHRFEGAYTREAAEHFCPWYSGGAGAAGGGAGGGVGGGRGENESFPPVPPDVPGVVGVGVLFRAPRPPHAVEARGRAGEVDPRQVAARERRVADLGSGAV